MAFTVIKRFNAEKGLVVGAFQTSNPATSQEGNTHARKELYAVRDSTQSGGYKMKIEEEFTSTKNEPTVPDKFVVELDCVMFAPKKKFCLKKRFKKIFRRWNNE